MTISNKSIFSANASTYNTYEILSNKKALSITVVSGKINYINVTVKNASQKAWTGLGKQFETLEIANENYKDKNIKAAIQHLINFKIYN